MVFILAVGSGEVDVPPVVEVVEFGCPDFFGIGAGFRSLPDEMFLAEGGEVFAGVNGDAAVAIGEAPKVAVRC